MFAWQFNCFGEFVSPTFIENKTNRIVLVLEKKKTNEKNRCEVRGLLNSSLTLETILKLWLLDIFHLLSKNYNVRKIQTASGANRIFVYIYFKVVLFFTLNCVTHKPLKKRKYKFRSYIENVLKENYLRVMV